MTEIRLYDTATRTKQVLRPLDPANVRMYVCGPTVYDRAHIGNARPVVVFDVLYRLLRHVYGTDAVTYVRNFTDVDDKINKRAAETRGDGESTLDAIRRITDQTIGWYRDDMGALGALPPDHEPRATDYVSDPAQPVDMVRMIQALIERGCAYEAEGHVLFDVASYSDYGRLSRRPLDEMEAGARVEVAPYKRSPLDFVLWKPSDESLPGWESPWGRGRPGWHIECSAMSKALLGERFDIHGGGIDLAFPHHENELAQSCCANDADQMASIWMHNGYLMVEGEKMSKSLGNFFTVKDLLDKGVPGEVIRMVLLSAHYRQPLDWTSEHIEQERRRLINWRTNLAAFGRAFWARNSKGSVSADFLNALSDDLNLPAAFAALAESVKRMIAGDETAAAEIIGSMRIIGIDPNEGNALETMFDASDRAKAHHRLASEHAAEIQAVLTKRAAAKKSKNFTEADRLRDELKEAGIGVMDTADGPRWTILKDFDPAKLEALK